MAIQRQFCVGSMCAEVCAELHGTRGWGGRGTTGRDSDVSANSLPGVPLCDTSSIHSNIISYDRSPLPHTEAQQQQHNTGHHSPDDNTAASILRVG